MLGSSYGFVAITLFLVTTVVVWSTVSESVVEYSNLVDAPMVEVTTSSEVVGSVVEVNIEVKHVRSYEVVLKDIVIESERGLISVFNSSSKSCQVAVRMLGFTKVLRGGQTGRINMKIPVVCSGLRPGREYRLFLIFNSGIKVTTFRVSATPPENDAFRVFLYLPNEYGCWLTLASRGPSYDLTDSSVWSVAGGTWYEAEDEFGDWVVVGNDTETGSGIFSNVSAMYINEDFGYYQEVWLSTAFKLYSDSVDGWRGITILRYDFLRGWFIVLDRGELKIVEFNTKNKGIEFELKSVDKVVAYNPSEWYVLVVNAVRDVPNPNRVYISAYLYNENNSVVAKVGAVSSFGHYWEFLNYFGVVVNDTASMFKIFTVSSSLNSSIFLTNFTPTTNVTAIVGDEEVNGTADEGGNLIIDFPFETSVLRNVVFKYWCPANNELVTDVIDWVVGGSTYTLAREAYDEIFNGSVVVRITGPEEREVLKFVLEGTGVLSLNVTEVELSPGVLVDVWITDGNFTYAGVSISDEGVTTFEYCDPAILLGGTYYVFVKVTPQTDDFSGVVSLNLLLTSLEDPTQEIPISLDIEINQ